jgi:hypothetical protein
MEADLVGLRGGESAALLCPDVDDDRAPQVEGLLEGAQERLDVVSGHEPDVRDSEVLEQPPGLGEVDDGAAKSLAQLTDRRPGNRDPSDEVVVGLLARLPGTRELDLAEVLRQRADRRADRHLVVVENDEQLRLALADVVQRLQAQATRDGGVADDDGNPLHAVAQVTRGREALADRQAGPGVTAVEDVVLGFAASREAADPAELAKRAKSLEPSGEQLVGIRLMAGVPDDPVARRLEEPVERDRELDDAERAAEMAAGPGDRRDDRLADLFGELLELRRCQAAEIGGAVEGGQDQHAWLGLLVRR